MKTIKDYIFNLETTKIELHFEKADFDALPEQHKSELRSAFLWSPKGKCWISRAKEPNLYRAKRVAEMLGFTEEKRDGERISYAEQVERQSESAENRADRYDEYAENAEKRAAQLQKPLDSMRGDTAFFTQPIIAGHAGSRAFANRRERMYAQYHKGFEEYRKSDYFKNRAQTARKTADAAKFKDKGYLDRRINECKKEIRDREGYLIKYENILNSLENGEEKEKSNGGLHTAEELISCIEYQTELIAKAMDKQGYLEFCLDELVGVQFSKDSIKVGYIVKLIRWGNVEITSTGPKNVVYKILTGGASGYGGKAAYAEIKEIIKAEEKKDIDGHPFIIGERYTATRLTYPKEHSFETVKSEVIYEIVKATDKTIQLKAIGTEEKPITRKPAKTRSGEWMFSIDDSHVNTFYKVREGL